MSSDYLYSDGVYVVCVSSVTFVRPILRRLKFSAMFLHRLVPWPSVDCSHTSGIKRDL